MNICSFIGCSCHPAELGTFPNRKSVIRQFNAVNSPETTPKEIFLSSILYIEGSMEFCTLISLLRNIFP